MSALDGVMRVSFEFFMRVLAFLADYETAAIVNGTLYIYGGRAKTEADQTSNTWSQ